MALSAHSTHLAWIRFSAWNQTVLSPWRVICVPFFCSLCLLLRCSVWLFWRTFPNFHIEVPFAKHFKRRGHRAWTAVGYVICYNLYSIACWYYFDSSSMCITCSIYTFPPILPALCLFSKSWSSYREWSIVGGEMQRVLQHRAAVECAVCKLGVELILLITNRQKTICSLLK